MDVITAKHLANELSMVALRRAREGDRKAAGVTVEIREDRIAFVRYGRPEHSIAIGPSDEARAWAHFNGFIGERPNTLPRVGDRISFRRGMYGIWTGTVVRVGEHKLTHDRPGRAFFLVEFKRRQGDLARLAIETFDLVNLSRSGS